MYTYFVIYNLLFKYIINEYGKSEQKLHAPHKLLLNGQFYT